MYSVEIQDVLPAMSDYQFGETGPTSVGCTQTCDSGPTSVGCTQTCDSGPTSVGCTQTCDSGPTSVGCTQTCGSALMTSRQNFVAPAQNRHQSQAFQAAPAFLC